MSETGTQKLVEVLRRPGGTDSETLIAACLEAARVLELAYGLLWQARVDKRDPTGLAVSLARGELLAALDTDGQAGGIHAGRLALRTALDESRKNSRTKADFVAMHLNIWTETPDG